MPREHGAYAQLGISLVMALTLVPGSLWAWGQVLATVLVFLASEPVLVLLGRRGEEQKKNGAVLARRRLGAFLLVLVVLLSWLWGGNPLRQTLSNLPALGLGAGLLWLFLARREHSISGELLAAGAFSFASLPVLVVGGMDPAHALMPVLGMAALNGLGTILVRSFLASLKRESAWPRLVPVLLGVALTVGAGIGSLPWPLILAPLPLTVLALRVLVSPPSASELRKVGWLLTLARALGAFGLVMARG